MFQTALHYLVALTLVFSTAGIAVHQHFCSDQLKSIALWTSATPCKTDGQSCSMDKDEDGDCERSCCEDKVSVEKADIDLYPSQTPLLTDLTDQHPATFISLNKVLVSPPGSLSCLNALRAPPLYTPSIQVLYCTFLC